MFYTITIYHPKSKTKQFSTELTKGVSELNDIDFSSLIINQHNHFNLADKVRKNKIEYNGQNLTWDPTPQQLNYITQYYSDNPLQFADKNTNPGENNTLPINDGLEPYKYYSTRQHKNDSYITIGIQEIPYFRYFNRNYTVPNKLTNPLYTRIPQLPSVEIFTKKVKDLLASGYLTSPLTYIKYETKPSSFFTENDVLYRFPINREKEEWAPYKEAFESIQTEFPLQPLDKEACKALLLQIDNLSQHSYQEFINDLPVAKLYGKRNTYYFEYNGINYIVPTPKEMYKPPYREVWDEIMKDKEKNTSIANKVFRQIEKNYSNILPANYRFETEYKIHKDPRIYKLIEELGVKEKETVNIFRFLFNILQDKKTKNGWLFNLSNTHFYPTNPMWQNQINNNKLTEFQIRWEESSNIATKKYQRKLVCFSNLPAPPRKDNKTGISTIRTELYPSNIRWKEYAFDLAVVNSNDETVAILEFDGSDHFRPRNYSNQENKDFLSRIVSDQLKSLFAKKESIPIIRIPDYFKKGKSNIFEQEFLDFSLRKLKDIIPEINLPDTLTDTDNTKLL